MLLFGKILQEPRSLEVAVFKNIVRGKYKIRTIKLISYHTICLRDKNGIFTTNLMCEKHLVFKPSTRE